MSESSGSSLGSLGGWSLSRNKTAVSPKSLLKKYNLPIAAYLKTTPSPPGLDVTQPILLYSNFQSIKVRAVSLRIGRNDMVFPVGPSLVIPDAYTGWFSVVTPGNHCAPHYTSIETVASNKVPYFLTRYDLSAYVKTEDPEDSRRVTYQKTLIQGGNVLKLMGVYQDINSKKCFYIQPRESRVFSSNCNKYVQCLNCFNEVIYVSFSSTGKFYATAHKGCKSKNHVFLMSQLLNTFKLPVTVRLVCGYMSKIPVAFTGILRLEKSQKENVILGCTMTSHATATLLEMDISSNFLLTPITDLMFSKTPIFLKTVSYCKDEADSWKRQIKVTHRVSDDSSGSSLGRSSSEKTNSSTSSNPAGFSFFKEVERNRLRGREKYRNNQVTFNESRQFDTRHSDKEIPDIKPREKSKESRIRSVITERFRDISLNRQRIPPLRQIFYNRGRSGDKLSKQKKDERNLSKQNTYVFQKSRSTKWQDKLRLGGRSKQTPKPCESQEYCNVIDDISHNINFEDAGEHQYSEINITGLISDSTSKDMPSSSLSSARFWNSNSPDMKMYPSSTEDSGYGFTLLKNDTTKWYRNFKGLGIQDVGKFNFKRSEAYLY